MDPEFESTQDFTESNTDITDLESSLNEMEIGQIDDYSEGMNFEKFIVLNKRDVTNFTRTIEPLIKNTIDDYGKSVFITSVDQDTVELRYFNAQYIVCMKVANKSQKLIKDFALLATTLKKLVTNAYSSIVFVEDDDEINLALSESLLYLETKPLDKKLYDFKRVNPEHFMDKEIALYTFKKIGSMLTASDRASEKVIVIKNNHANFNTGYFAAKSKSPFVKSEDFILFKAVSEVLGVLSDVSKVDLRYKIQGDKLIVSCDGMLYCELPIAGQEKVEEFYSLTAENALKFDADIVVVNDSLLRLIQVVKSLDYLSDIVTIEFTKKKMILTITTSNQTKPSIYKFEIVEGSPSRIGEMKVSVDILTTFFGVTGTDIFYAFTEEGLGIKNDLGVFIIRRS